MAVVVKRKGELYTATYFYPSMGQTDAAAVTQAVSLWIAMRFDFYERVYIKPLVDDWQSKDVPTFTRSFSAGSSVVRGKWQTESIPFLYLDGGAEAMNVRRKVAMQPGRTSKTKAGKFGSFGSGQRVLKRRGRKVFFGRGKFKIIRARKWMIEIGKREVKLLGGAGRKGLGSPGVMFSMFEQAIFVENMDKGWTRSKLKGATFVTPADPYFLPTVKKKITTIRI